MNGHPAGAAGNEEEKRLIARFSDLVRRAARGIEGKSDFLDLRQQELAQSVAVHAQTSAWELEGGYPQAERKRLLLYPKKRSGAEAGIACLRIRPVETGRQPPGHRDYLGAVLNLGIKREKIGDIVLQNDMAFLFADLDLAEYICQQLFKVGRTGVKAEQIPREDFVFQPPQPTMIEAHLASLRLDAAVAAAFRLSRSAAEAYIENGQVRINQVETGKRAAAVQPGDLISVRGLGRFRLDQVSGRSRKGRYHVQIARW